MVPHPTRTEQKHVLLKAYSHLNQIDQALKIVRIKTAGDIQISVLGKKNFTLLKRGSKPFQNKKELKNYWTQALGMKTDFGFFSNPEIGTIFIAGPLTSMFMHDIDDKKLGAMTDGPYGILRGLGIDSEQSAEYIKILSKGGYLLMVRGYDSDLNRLKDALIPLD